MQIIHWLNEQFQHMEWADACVWKSVSELPQAVNDMQIRDRLYHIHATQHALYQIWNESPLDIPELSAFKELNQLLLWAKNYYQQLPNYLDCLDHSKLEQKIIIPWEKHIEKKFGKTPQTCTLVQTMLQVISHSTYHRGQLNSVLRRLGGAPPAVDFIVWIWQGKMEVDWLISIKPSA
jgi:uncharacterized damage-inducible protein DinB